MWWKNCWVSISWFVWTASWEMYLFDKFFLFLFTDFLILQLRLLQTLTVPFTLHLLMLTLVLCLYIFLCFSPFLLQHLSISTWATDEVFLRLYSFRRSHSALSFGTLIIWRIVFVLFFLSFFFFSVLLTSSLPSFLELCWLRTLGSLLSNIVFNFVKDVRVCFKRVLKVGNVALLCLAGPRHLSYHA